MSKIRVTKEFRFEMAHALWNYDGLCKNIHGHSYVLYVTVIGEPISDIDDKKLGMVIDFGDLKKIVEEEITKKFDHSIILNNKVPYNELYTNSEMFERKYFVDYQPTCENIVLDFVLKIKNRLPENIDLYNIRLYETATSYAEWNKEDNL